MDAFLRAAASKKGESDAARRPNRLIYFFVASTSSSLPLTPKNANPITFNSFTPAKKKWKIHGVNLSILKAGDSGKKKFGEGRRWLI